MLLLSPWHLGAVDMGLWGGPGVTPPGVTPPGATPPGVPPPDAPPPPAGLGAKPLMKSKQANLSKNPPLSAKERRMSAIRALHARKEANKKKSEKGEI